MKARGGNQGKPAVDAKIDARFKARRIEAVAFIRDGEMATVVQAHLMHRYTALPGDKVVKLVPYSAADAAVLKAADEMVEADRAAGWNLGDLDDNPKVIALWEAVSRRQKALKKKPVTPPK